LPQQSVRPIGAAWFVRVADAAEHYFAMEKQIAASVKPHSNTKALQ
jgi:hypothetical protein